MNTLQEQGRILFCITIQFSAKNFPMPQAMNVPDAKAAVDKEWKKSLRQFQHGTWEKSRAKRRIIREAQKTPIKFTSFIDWLMSCKEFGVGATIPEVQGKSCFSRRCCERRLWSLCSIYWTGLISIGNDGRKSNDCYCSTTRIVMDKQLTPYRPTLR